jgi:sporulation protein YlmC with PRC-barrel domain
VVNVGHARAVAEVLQLVLNPDRKEVVVLVVAQHHRVENVAMVHARVVAVAEVLQLVLNPDRKEVVVLVVAQHHRVKNVAMVHARALVAEAVDNHRVLVAKTKGEVRVAVAVI